MAMPEPQRPLLFFGTTLRFCVDLDALFVLSVPGTYTLSLQDQEGRKQYDQAAFRLWSFTSPLPSVPPERPGSPLVVVKRPDNAVFCEFGAMVTRFPVNECAYFQDIEGVIGEDVQGHAELGPATDGDKRMQLLVVKVATPDPVVRAKYVKGRALHFKVPHSPIHSFLPVADGTKIVRGEMDSYGQIFVELEQGKQHSVAHFDLWSGRAEVVKDATTIWGGPLVGEDRSMVLVYQKDDLDKNALHDKYKLLWNTLQGPGYDQWSEIVNQAATPTQPGAKPAAKP